MPPRLIVNADDFGLTPGINRAVIELHRAGAITSATLMANGPAFDDAAHLALANPTLGVGCHLVFAGGVPVSHPDSIPSLLGADGKTFRPSLADFVQAALRGTISPDDVARETQAQIQKLQRIGIDVTHVDTHKHTHLLPMIARPVLHIANRCGLRSIRNPISPRWSPAAAQVALLRRLGLQLMRLFEPAFQRLTRDAREQGLVAEGTLGIAATGVMDEPLLRRTVESFIEHGPDILCELLCHPGFQDAALDGERTRLRASREVEYEILLKVIPEYSRTPERLQLIHYGSLGIAGLQRASGQYARPSGFEKVL